MDNNAKYYFLSGILVFLTILFIGGKMFKKLVCLSVLTGIILLTGCSRTESSSNGGKSLQIKGSDTMVNLGQAWAEAFQKKNTNISVGVTGGGSGTGFAALLNGTCDIASASRQVEEKEIAKAKETNMVFSEFKIGLDGLAVVVNPANKVTKLTIAQLRDIFTGTKTNWKDFGGKDGKIVILSRESNSGTHVFFKEHVLRLGNKKGTEEFASNALLMPSSQAISDEVAQNQNAIGYFGMGYLSKKIKVVAVAKDVSAAYVEPTIDNVKSNKYPISRPLFLYTANAPAGAVKEFIDYTLSDEGQQIVRSIDFVPVIERGNK